MAGPTLAAPSATTRTVRLHGAFTTETARVAVVSSRKRGDPFVGMATGTAAADHSQFAVRLSAAEARLLARALLEAASAVDLAQRQPQFTRGARHV